MRMQRAPPSRPAPNRGLTDVTVTTLLIILLVLLIIGAIPSWPHSSGWGYGPVGVLVVVLLVLVLTGRI
jgi:Protein of unknown function (DUF3309)